MHAVRVKDEHVLSATEPEKEKPFFEFALPVDISPRFPFYEDQRWRVGWWVG